MRCAVALFQQDPSIWSPKMPVTGASGLDAKVLLGVLVVTFV